MGIKKMREVAPYIKKMKISKSQRLQELRECFIEQDPLEIFKGDNLIALAVLGAFEVFDKDLIRIIENDN